LALAANSQSMSCRAKGLRALSSLLAVLVLSSTFSVAEQGKKSSVDATLRITGKIDRPMVVRPADLQRMTRKRVTVTDDHGARVTYEGVPVVDLLEGARVPLGRRLRGTQLRYYVLVSASDGYQVVFALPEFDPAFTAELSCWPTNAMQNRFYRLRDLSALSFLPRSVMRDGFGK